MEIKKNKYTDVLIWIILKAILANQIAYSIGRKFSV
jgi:hypothetical protein